MFMICYDCHYYSMVFMICYDCHYYSMVFMICYDCHYYSMVYGKRRRKKHSLVGQDT